MRIKRFNELNENKSNDRYICPMPLYGGKVQRGDIFVQMKNPHYYRPEWLEPDKETAGFMPAEIVTRWVKVDDNIIFSEFIDDEIRVYTEKLRELFSFVGDGIFDIGYDLKHNKVWIEFYDEPTGTIEPEDFIKVKNILDVYMDEHDNVPGLINYKIDFRLNLYFDEDYSMGIY